MKNDPSRRFRLLLAVVAAALVLGVQPAVAGKPLGEPFVVGDFSDQAVDAVHPSAAFDTIPGFDRYLVVWYNDRPGCDDIFGRIVDQKGTPLGPRRAIANGCGAERRYPDVAFNPNGNEFLVVWEHTDEASGRITVRGRRVNIDGEPQYSEFTISDSTCLCTASKPKVDHAFTAGLYLVVWENHTQGNVSTDIHGQLIDLTGTAPNTSILTIAQGTWSATHSVPDLAYNRRRNEFLVAWQQWDSGSGLDHVYGRIVRPDRTMPSAFAIAQDAAKSSTAPAVAAIPSAGPAGQYLVAWEFWYSATDRDMKVRRFDGLGNALDSGFSVSELGYDEFDPIVEGNERSSKYLVAWTAASGWNTIYAREIRSDGTFLGQSELLGGAGAGQPTISDGPGGDFLVAFQDGLATPRYVIGMLWGNRVYLPIALRR